MSMSAWADDPELVATFRAEVEERLASLTTGLLQLEGHSSPKQLVAALFRDAHTVKGSARMLGLEGVLQVSHLLEDVLGSLRDLRLAARRDVVDLLLASCDGITRALPGAQRPLSAEALDPLLVALRSALAGDEPVAVPVLEAGTSEAEGVEDDASDHDERRHRGVDSIRVGAAKVYDLLDVVGEAELEVRRVEQAVHDALGAASDHGRWARTLRDSLASVSLSAEAELALHRLLGIGETMAGGGLELRELVGEARGRLAQVRDGAMGLAMVPVRRVTAALPRLLRDVAVATGKDVRLVVEGEDVELDKKVLDGVADALKHLVINAVDHGCEPGDERVAAGKPAQATVTLAARSAGGTVVIEVSDDGRGIDEEAVRAAAIAKGLLTPDALLSGPALLGLLFTPAFSTAEAVTETSGRGVGLDVVQLAVEDLGGTVQIQTEVGRGTTFVLTLPVTLGVLRCLVARVGEERYAIPVPGVVESVSLRDAEVHQVAGATVMVRHGVSLPLVDLGGALGVAGERAPRAAILVRHASTGEQLAWAVDKLEGELELVVKDLGPFLGRLPMVTGATIDGDGSVVCLVDLRELAVRATGATTPVQLPGAREREDSAAAARGGVRKPRVLVVEDSVGVRELERVILEGAGYEVLACVDGLDGASKLRDEPVDVVVSDVEMPGMDGFTLTRTIRRTRGWEQVPVIIMTSRGDESDRRAGLEAGASAYLLKSEFDQTQLVETVRRLVGR
ncbi:MAG: two-component system, chemotaxis family, sensor kinase CheA [Frankiales bacterium]|nr:two-component system, chemotaxis family, sensor kinase CheA [Frankiales bacterium]